jgi:DHA2 family multidrug resistance protein-like MFS transporter
MPADHIHRRRWWTLAVLSISLLVISLDNTILNVALPSIAVDLHASSSALQWVVDAYMLVFAGLLLTAGSLGDRTGRRRALSAGLLVFGAGSVLASLAGDTGQLIASRALMGVGGALIMPSTLSILTAVFPAEERAKAIGAWAAVAGLGIALGPIAGGWLVEHADWHWVFLVNVPIVLVALALGRVLVPESRDPRRSAIDLPGAALSTLGLTALLWGLIEAPSRGWTDGAILGAFAAAAAILALFAAWELHTPAPMLDVRLFANRRFSAASGAIALAFFGLFGVLFFTSQYLQDVHGFGPLQAGVWSLPVAGGLALGGPLSARIGAALGTKLTVSAGLAVLAGGLALYATARPGSGFALVGGAEAILGLGIGLAMTPATDSIMGTLPPERASVGSAMNDTVRQLGGALGVAVLGSVLSSHYRDGMDAAAHGLPAPAGHAAQDSIGGAAAVAERIGGAAGQALHHTASLAFVDAMQVAMLVAAAVTAAGALVALTLLPTRATGDGPDPALDRAPVAVAPVATPVAA